VQGLLDAAGAAHRDTKRFLIEVGLEGAEWGVVETDRDDRKVLLAPLFLNLEGMPRLLADPGRLECSRADQDGIGRGLCDGLLDGGPEQIAAAQLA